MAAATLPAAFLGHGSPMNTLERNRYTDAWRAFGASMPRPRAILMVSAHWYVNATAVTAMAQPRTIHDFYGFPPELFAVRYGAPGLPALAEEVADVVKPEFVGADHESWGIDHGTWSVLVHAFPKADVPVVQLSINAQKPFDFHLALGAKLAPLRERGVLVMASGNVVHNLRRIDFRRPELAFDWSERFDAAVKAVMTRHPADLAGVRVHADYAAAVPTPEHFLPLAYLAGLCEAAGEPAKPFAEGCTMGSISMTGYLLGAEPPGGGTGKAAAALPRGVPADDTNI